MFAQNMLTSQDIIKLIEAEKSVFSTKEDIQSLRHDFSVLGSSVDGYAKRADTYFSEMVVLTHRVARMEEWIRSVATKIGIEFKA